MNFYNYTELVTINEVSIVSYLSTLSKQENERKGSSHVESE